MRHDDAMVYCSIEKQWPGETNERTRARGRRKSCHLSQRQRQQRGMTGTDDNSNTARQYHQSDNSITEMPGAPSGLLRELHSEYAK